jgi:peptidoglycan hydrolase-like protein with peptidoglycan-binding domain
MRLSLILLFVILGPMSLAGCLSGGAGMAANVAIRVLPAVIKYAPKVVETAQETVANLTDDPQPGLPDKARKSDRTDRAICSYATLRRASEWDYRAKFEGYVAEARRRQLTLPRCKVILGFPSNSEANTLVASNHPGTVQQTGNPPPKSREYWKKYWKDRETSPGQNVQISREASKKGAFKSVDGELIVRLFPDSSAHEIARLGPGQKFVVERQTTDGWNFIKFSNGRHGYVRPRGALSLETVMAQEKIRVNLIGGAVPGLKSEPSEGSRRVAWIGGSVVVLGYVDGGAWVHVQSGELTGYIRSTYLKRSDAVAGGPIRTFKPNQAKSVAKHQTEVEERRLALQRKSQAKAAAADRARQRKLAEERSAEGARKRLSKAQTALSKVGLYQGKVDGVSGPRTSAAVAQWLKKNGQSEGAKLTDEIVILMQRQAKVRQDKALAALRQTHKHSIAVIIGNRHYTGRTPDVEYADNDADAARSFVTGNLGYRPGNVIDLRDASLTQLNATFGTTGNHRGRLFDYVRPGKSDVIVFYSGHGVPGLRDRKGYLLPVDADPNRAELNGYPLEVLLANLAKVPSRSMAVYIDACFSGESQKGMLVQATSGITVQAKMPGSSKAMVVVTAAQNDQFASWDEDAKHGLFTKHLLDALRGKADGKGFGNGDGKVTLSELKAYLDEEMTYQARRRWSRDQNASIQGADSAVLATLQ